MKKIKYPMSKLGCMYTWFILPFSLVAVLMTAAGLISHLFIPNLADALGFFDNIANGEFANVVVDGILNTAIYLILVSGSIIATVVMLIAGVVGAILGISTTFPFTIAAFTGKPPLLQQLMVSVAAIFHSLLFLAATIFNVLRAIFAFIMHPVFGWITVAFAVCSALAIPAYFLWFVLAWLSVKESFTFKKKKKEKNQKVEEVILLETNED